jgi:hypothetical protein
MRLLAVNEMLRRVFEHQGLYGTLVNPPDRDGETMYEPFGKHARDKRTGEVELASSL